MVTGSITDPSTSIERDKKAKKTTYALAQSFKWCQLIKQRRLIQVSEIPQLRNLIMRNKSNNCSPINRSSSSWPSATPRTNSKFICRLLRQLKLRTNALPKKAFWRNPAWWQQKCWTLADVVNCHKKSRPSKMERSLSEEAGHTLRSRWHLKECSCSELRTAR